MQRKDGAEPESIPSTAAGMDTPATRELAALFHEAFQASTGQAARWAAERIHGNVRFERAWCVPFHGHGLRGCFTLRWDEQLQRYLGTRVGEKASRPEYLGAVLRSAAGRWCQQQGQRHGMSLRLLPSAEAAPEVQGMAPTCSAALFVDAFVLELGFIVDDTTSARP